MKRVHRWLPVGSGYFMFQTLLLTHFDCSESEAPPPLSEILTVIRFSVWTASTLTEGIFLVFGWRTSVGGNASSHRRVKNSQYSHALEQLWDFQRLCGQWSGVCSAPDWTASHTLNALCSGMLVLEAATTKIKRGYFLPPPRPEISTLSWQQSKESRGVWLLLFKETTGLKKKPSLAY